MSAITTADAVDVIPDELKALGQWFNWKTVVRNGKPTKCPCQPDGKPASSTDPDTWTDFDTACRAASRFDGIGFVFTPDDPYTGVDLDSCVKDGVISPEAQARINSLDSYSEFSVRGEGVHILVRAEQRHSSKRKGKVEAYNRGRFFAMTGNHIPGTPETIECRQVELDALLLECFGPNHGAEEKAPSIAAISRPLDLSDAELLAKAMRSKKTGADFSALWNGQIPAGKSHSEADLALCKHLAYWTGRDPGRIDRLFRQSGLMRKKWDRQDYRERTIAEAIAKTTKVYTPREDAPPPEPPSEPFDGGLDDEPPSESEAEAAEPDIAAEAEPPPDNREAGPEESEPERRLFRLADLLAGELEPVEWIVDRLIPRHGVSIVGGDSGVGKSWIGYHLALSVAAGIPFLGHFPTRQCPVLIFDAESGEGLIRRRIKKLFTGLAIDGHSLTDDLPVEVFASPLRVDPPKELNGLVNFINRVGFGLCVVDPLIHCLPASASENDSVAMARFFESIRYVQAETGATFLFCHHSRKRSHLAPSDAGQMLRGSSAIRGILDSHLFLRKLRPGVLLAEHDKSRHAEAVPSFVVEITDPDEQSTTVRYGGEAEESADQTAVAAAFVERALTDAGGTLPRKELLAMAEGGNLKERTIVRALTEAVDSGTVTKARDGNSVIYTLRVQGELWTE